LNGEELPTKPGTTKGIYFPYTYFQTGSAHGAIISS